MDTDVRSLRGLERWERGREEEESGQSVQKPVRMKKREEVVAVGKE